MSKTNDDRAIEAALRLKAVFDAFAPTEGNPFAGVGPSDDFLNTHLPSSVAKPEEVARISAAIDKAAKNRDMETINKILGMVTGIIGPAKALFGVV
jgi:hypothetical protein